MDRKKHDPDHSKALEFESAFTFSPEAITMSDLNGNITNCNKAALDLHGYSSKNELIGKSALTLIAKKDHGRAIKNMKETMKRGSIKNIEYTFLRKDGSEFQAELSASVVKDPSSNPVSFMAITKDITERKKMEKEIENLAKFPSENENPVLRISRDYDILYANKASREFLEYWGCEIGGKSCKFCREIVAEAFEKESSFSWEVRFKDKVYSFFVTPILDAGYVNLYGRDITERKKMEKEIKQHSEELGKLVEERTKKLRDAERMAAIGETAAMVGHDLRNPLQVIYNTLHLAKKRLKSVPASQRRFLMETQALEEPLQTIEDSVEYMDMIISDLQEYSKPLKPKFVSTSLKKLIDSSISSVDILENIKVSVSVQPRLKAVVDLVLMKRCLINIISNAVEAMQEGGDLTIKTSKRGKDVLIFIQDTGVGIPEENMSKLLKPYPTTKTRGIGLGLVYCKRIVDAHDGSITVESKVNEGSTFTVRIPMKREVS